MQHIGINPSRAYRSHTEMSRSGFVPGQYGEDNLGNLYVFLKFQTTIESFAPVSFGEDNVGSSPSARLNSQAPIAVVHFAVGGSASTPEWGWALLRGNGRGRFKTTMVQGGGLLLSHAGTWNPAVGLTDPVQGFFLEEASTPANTPRIQMTFPGTTR